MNAPTCVFSETTGRKSAPFRCRLGLFEDIEMPECCATCSRYSGPSRGVGERIKKITDKLGIKQCGGCAKRQAMLNRASEVAKSIAAYKERG